MHAVQGVVARGGVRIRHQRNQRGARDLAGDLAAMCLEHGGHDVDRLGKLVRVLAGARAAREVDDERQMRQLVIQVHVVLAHVVALAQEVPVVGGDHDHGVLEHAVFVQLIDQLAKPVIGHGDQGLVTALDVIDRTGVEVSVRDALVLRGLEVIAVKLALATVHLHVFVRHVKGLMRVKSLDHQEEIILALVVLHPVACGLEGLGAGHIFLMRPLLAILLILLAHAAVKGLRHVIGFVDAAHPGVALLPAIVIPRVEFLQVALATGAQIVTVVGSDVAKGAGRAQALGQRHVKGLDGTPGALKKVVAAAHDVATSRHAGGGANPVVVEHARALRKPVQVGRLHLSLGVVAREHVATQRVHQHQYRSHDSPFQHIRWSTRLFLDEDLVQIERLGTRLGTRAKRFRLRTTRPAWGLAGRAVLSRKRRAPREGSAP